MSLPYDIASTDEKVSEHLAAGGGLHPVIARILAGRGITEIWQAHRFLHPSSDMLHDPFLLPSMDAAVDRVNSAIASGEKILIHGDYDTDGITSTALLKQTLEMLGAETDYFIPNRLDEGYGLKMEGVEHARSIGAKLIITCDCGTSSVEEVAAAAEEGIDVVVTDHHEQEGELPPAVAVVNPKAKGSKYPFTGLAGVGVAAKLVMALLESRGSSPPLTGIMRICAIGTVADVVPLVDENRFIAQHGLAHLAGTPNIGLKELFRSAGIDAATISSYDIGFRIAPRINATGRFGMHELAMRLFFTRDVREARQIAQTMNELNIKRQNMVDHMYEQAVELFEGRSGHEQEKIIVLGDSSWHKGVVGLVASKLVERYKRPALIFAIEDDIAHGSGRSIPAFNLVENLGEVAHLFTRYGGHAMAAGFELPSGKIRELRQSLLAIAGEKVTEEIMRAAQVADAKASLADFNGAFQEQYKLLEPFGFGNETPVLVSRGVQLAAPPHVLKERHLKLKFRDPGGGPTITALAWHKADRAEELVAGAHYDIAYYINFNRWRGNEELQLTIRDFSFKKK